MTRITGWCQDLSEANLKPLYQLGVELHLGGDTHRPDGNIQGFAYGMGYIRGLLAALAQ